MATHQTKTSISIEALRHDEATRRNIPTAEYQAVLARAEQAPVRVAIERRNRDLDPQLVWRGKDAQDQSDLVVQAAPLYIQEKVHPKVLVDDLRRQTEQRREAQAQQPGAIVDLFADFNGLPSEAARTEFYQHDAHWANRMILGDSLRWPAWPSAKGCVARCSASISIRPTASYSTATSSGARRAAT